MSYVRLGESGSDVYIYDSVSGGLNCCGCTLREHDPYFGDHGYQQMLDHIAEHRAAGHHIPEWVDAELRQHQFDHAAEDES